MIFKKLIKFFSTKEDNPTDTYMKDVTNASNSGEQSEPEDSKPNISEPVTSFIKCFKQNPKRFKLNPIKSENKANCAGRYEYDFIDTQTGDLWKVTKRLGRETTIYYADWITREEINQIVNTVSDYYYNRARKLYMIRDQRKQRKHNRERQRLTKIYKG